MIITLNFLVIRKTKTKKYKQNFHTFNKLIVIPKILRQKPIDSTLS